MKNNNTQLFSKAIFIICFLFFFQLSNAQDWSGDTYKYYQLYPGYIINNSGDTIKGYIEHGDRTRNQTKCVFYKDISDSKTKKVYKPDELKGYSVGDKIYRTMHYSGGLFGKPLNFVLVAKQGRIARLYYYTKDEGYVIQVRKQGETDAQYDARISKEEIVWQKENEDPVANTSLFLGFAKKLGKMIADYPELAKKVENKEKGYTALKILDIIDEYNNWWKSQTTK